MRSAYEFRIGARNLVIVELQCSEFLRCLQAAGDDPSSPAGQHALGVATTRHAIREIDGRRVTYQDLLVEWSTLFPLARDLLPVLRAINTIHSPTRAQAEAFRASWRCEVAGTEERWTARLPCERDVTMVPMGAQSLGDILRAAEGASKSSQSARAFGALLESLSRGIVAVDGVSVRPSVADLDGLLQVRDAQLLSLLWDEMNGVSADVGELKPVPGT